MSKKITDLSIEELTKDYEKATLLSNQVSELEEKYTNLQTMFGTMYGLRKAIREEIGRRSLDK